MGGRGREIITNGPGVSAPAMSNVMGLSGEEGGRNQPGQNQGEK